MQFENVGFSTAGVSRKRAPKYHFPAFIVHPMPDKAKGKTKIEINDATATMVGLTPENGENNGITFLTDYVANNRIFFVNSEAAGVDAELKFNKSFGASKKSVFTKLISSIDWMSAKEENVYEVVQIDETFNGQPVFEIVLQKSLTSDNDSTESANHEVPDYEENQDQGERPEAEPVSEETDDLF